MANTKECLRDMQNRLKGSKIHQLGYRLGEKREWKAVFEEKIPEQFSERNKNINPKVQEA